LSHYEHRFSDLLRPGKIALDKYWLGGRAGSVIRMKAMVKGSQCCHREWNLTLLCSLP